MASQYGTLLFGQTACLSEFVSELLHTIVIHALYIIHYRCTNTYTHKVLEYDYLCCIFVKNLIHRQEWPVVFFMQIADMKHCLFETQTGLAVDRVHPCDAALAGQASVTPAPE